MMEKKSFIFVFALELLDVDCEPQGKWPPINNTIEMCIFIHTLSQWTEQFRF